MTDAATKADFSDLSTRIFSAAVLLFVGLGLLYVGGDAFGVLLVVAAGLMGWELSRMHAVAPMVHFVFGLLLAALTLCLMFLPPLWAGFCTVLVIGAAFLGHQTRAPVVCWSVAIVITCTTLLVLRLEFGIGWTLWVLGIVVASDVGGYFAGKMIGGPKILPKISPKKTWSGTLGGWALAAILGFVFYVNGMAGIGIVVVSVLLAICAQIGDLLESLMKRRAGIKDASNLIPGHGGLLDRFDGTIGATCALAVVLALGFARVIGMS